MCVIDKERDVILLGRGARHPANMYSCLAGFIEVSWLLIQVSPESVRCEDVPLELLLSSVKVEKSCRLF
jgi:hypothetical protein